MEKTKGAIVVDERGDVIVLSRIDVQGDLLSNGAVPVFDVGTYLRSRNCMVGSRWSGSNCRVVCHAEDVLRLLEENGADLKTPASNAPEDLPEIVRLREQNAHLEARLKLLEGGKVASLK